MIMLIHGLFMRKEYTVFAFFVQLFGVVFLLVPYLVLKYNNFVALGPFVSDLHRLIVNPLLLILVIPALLYKHKTGS
ncbi:MAG: hypothetical protein AAFX87_19380 [Bacteroidota bacterium]